MANLQVKPQELIVGAIISRIKVGNEDIEAIDTHWRGLMSADKSMF